MPKGKKSKGQEQDYEVFDYNPSDSTHVQAFLNSKLFEASLRKYIVVFLRHHLQDREQWGFRQAMIHVAGVIKVAGGSIADHVQTAEETGAVLRTMKTVNRIVHEEAKRLYDERVHSGTALPGEEPLVTAMVHSNGTRT